MIKGVPASAGIAIGRAYLLENEEIVINRLDIAPQRVRLEVKRFKLALEATHRDLDATEAKALKMLGKEHARLIDTHRLILRDPLITKDVPKRILDEGVNAEFALSEALEVVNQTFEKMQDEFFRERRHDLFDVGKRLLSHLLKQEKKGLTDIKAPSILVARNLLPSDTLNLRENNILGFVTDLGGKSSHTALLAQSMEIPAVVGLSDASQRVKTGDQIIVDGDQGLVLIHPSPEAIVKYEKAREQSLQEEEALERFVGVPATTADGIRVRVKVNMDSPEELKPAAALRPDGVGLFRTEYLYLNRPSAPTEEEQSRIYIPVTRAFAPQPVVFRTADIGGDRLTQLGLEGPKNEANPFMGLRGIRIFLKHPDLMKTQFRAMLRAAPYGKVEVLLPMISSIEEIQGARRVFFEAHQELLAEGVEVPKKVPLGIMVEIPSAALMLDALLDEVDFVSIGTNDLIQYTLAVDRINEEVAHLYDPFHPAIVRLLHQIVETTHRRDKKVTVCGEMASDPRAVPLLVGLGVDVFSVTPRMFLRIKQIIRSIRMEDARAAIHKAVRMSDSREIQRLVGEL
ncbi:MAG: phosphoenolpyruvate--protein phosphotransferase [Elusimicrobia bacterium GWA2_69_24]|nr:MAG: phosphoenolpyruvate--protein phosphotransferase [Elusimicrobia bacterium GWA2_69_24]